MKDSRIRLVWLSLVYAAVALGILGFVGHTMLAQADHWQARSHHNRWAFRDVPTRRGSIRDAQGVLLVQDVPTSSLELLYKRFRRYHPVGAAVHGANLWRQHRGEEALVMDRDGLREALLVCLQLPARALRSATFDEAAKARDLRFYLGSLLAALHQGDYRTWRRRVMNLARSPRQGILHLELGLDAKAVAAAYRARLEELESLHQALILGARKPARRDLYLVLQRLQVATGLYQRLEAAEPTERRRLRELARASGLPDPHPEAVPYALHRRFPYPEARRIAQLKERHPGVRVRAAVDREWAEVDASLSWESLRANLGRMRRFGPADSPLQSRQVDEVREALAGVAQADPTLGEAHRQRVTWRLEDSLYRHLESEGRVGLGGVEQAMDAALRGVVGLHWIERRRGAEEVGFWDGFDVTPGADVRVSVDLRLQDVLERALQHAPSWSPQDKYRAVSAAVLVDARRGEILALAANPGPTARQALAEQEGGLARPDPLLRWWSAGHIGSLAKPLVLLEHLSAARQGRPFAGHQQFCACPGGSTRLSAFGPRTQAMMKRRLSCSHAHGDKVVDPVFSLADSCNYFFYQASAGLGRPGLQRAYRRFGLEAYQRPGQPAEIYAARMRRPIHGIPQASISRPSSSRQDKGVERHGIGYGVFANVLDVARAYAGLATTRLPELSLVQREAVAPGVDLLADTAVEDWLQVWEGMRRALTEGSARQLMDGLDASVPTVYAKTGTAIVDENRTYNNAWLAGFVGAPPDEARLVFVCVVYGTSLSGAKASSPIVKALLNSIAQRPDLAAYLR